MADNSLSRIFPQEFGDKMQVLSQNVTLIIEVRKSVTQTGLCLMKLSVLMLTMFLEFGQRCFWSGRISFLYSDLEHS